MTRPVGTAKLQIVGDVKDFADDVERDLNRALRSVKIDSHGLADKIAAGARSGVTQSERALDGLADDVDKTFAEISRDADRAFDHVASSAATAGEKVGHRFKAAGEVSERALQELDRQAGVQFQQIANKAGASAAATSSKWLAAWSVIRGAALAATTAMVASLTAITVFGLKSAAALEQTQIGLESLLGSADAAKSFIAELQKFAAATPFEFADVADASRRILAFGASVGIARKQVIPTLTVIGDLVSVLGGTSENIQSVIRALGQMASKGKVSQEEILQLAEALPGFNANAAIASSLGLSVADTLKLITAGGVSAKVGIDALLKGMAQFPGAAGAMAKQAQTLNGVFSTFKDTIAIALTDAFTPVVPEIKEALAKVTPVIGDAVKILAPALGEFLTKILPIASAAIAALAPLLGIFTDLAGTILTALSPGLEALAGVAVRLVEGLSPLAVTIGTFLGRALEELVKGGALDEIIEQFVAMTPALIDLIDALLPLLPPLAQLLALTLKIQTPLIQLLALVVDLLAVKALTPAIKAVADAANDLFEVLGPGIEFVTDIANWPKLFEAFGDKVGPVLSDAADDVGEFFAKIGRWFEELPGRIGSFLSSLPGVIGDAFKRALGAALDAVTHGIGLLIGAFLAFPPLAWQALKALPELLSDLWDMIFARGKEAWTAIADFVPTAIDRIVSEVTRVGKIIVDAFPAALAAAKKFVVDGFNSIVDFIFSVPGRIGALVPQMLAAGRNLISGLFSGLGEAGGFVGDLASKITGAIKGLLNRVIAGINSGIADVDDALPGISLPRIPQLATGGLTTGAGLANLHPTELVLPLEDRRVIDLLARAMTAAAAGDRGAGQGPVGAGTPAFDVRVFIGETELTDLIDVQIDERNRATRARVQARAGRR